MPENPSLTPRLRDWRDVAIETYAESVAERDAQIGALEQRVAHLEETVAWQLEIARANLDVSHALHVRNTKQRKQYLALAAEFRAYRERTAPRASRQTRAA